MNMQPYVSPEQPTAGGGRIVVPTSGYPNQNALPMAYPPPTPYGGYSPPGYPYPPAPAQPSLVTIIIQEIARRKVLLVLWLLATAMVIYAMVGRYAQPVWRSEGKLKYVPNQRLGLNPVYTPPNIQTVVQMCKSTDVLDKIREKHYPGDSREAFTQRYRIDVARSSEFIEIAFDDRDSTSADASANNLMAEALRHFNAERIKSKAKGIAAVQKAKQDAQADLSKAKDEYRHAHEKEGIADLKSEIERTLTEIADCDRAIRDLKTQQTKLQKEIDYHTSRRDMPDPDDKSFDDDFFNKFNSMMAQLREKTATQREVDQAKANLDAAMKEKERLEPLVVRQIIPRNEWDRLMAQIRGYEAVIHRNDEINQMAAELEKQFKEMQNRSKGGKIINRTAEAELIRLKAQLQAIPSTITTQERDKAERQERIRKLYDLDRSLLSKSEEIRQIDSRMMEYSRQLDDANSPKDPNADDLQIAVPATSGSTPHTSSAPKLAAVTAGISALLFFAFITLIALPQLSAAREPRVAPQPPQEKPRALVAMVPVATGPTGSVLPALPPVADAFTGVSASIPANALPIPPSAAPHTTANTVIHPTATVEPLPPPPTIPLVVRSSPGKTSPGPLPRNPIATGRTSDPAIRSGAIPVAPKPGSTAPVPTPSVVVHPPRSASPAGTPPLPPLVPPKPLIAEPIRGTDNPADSQAPLPFAEPVITPAPTAGAAPRINLDNLSTEAAKPGSAARKVLDSMLRRRVPSEPDPKITALAKKIEETGANKGGIVLMTPTTPHVSVDSVAGDLGHHFSRQGEKVLIFDARTTEETPSWGGPFAPKVRDRVLQFLDGNAQPAEQCFVPTLINGMEYSRADVENRVSGVMSAHRFRQLVEEMRERYSLVLMVAPPISSEGLGGLLPTLAEGMVVVTESNLAPEAIQTMLDSLADRSAAPVLGAVAGRPN